jgi:hypothetical protein
MAHHMDVVERNQSTTLERPRRLRLSIKTASGGGGCISHGQNGVASNAVVNRGLGRRILPRCSETCAVHGLILQNLTRSARHILSVPF